MLTTGVVTFRYRKKASNKCVSGVENSGKYGMLNVSCPVYQPEGLTLRVEHSVVPSKSEIIFTLSQTKVMS